MPDQLMTARMSDSTLGSDIDNKVSALELALSTILGVPLDTLINNPMFAVQAAGLFRVVLQDSVADPIAIGQIARNGVNYKIHDGTAAWTILHGGNYPSAVKTVDESLASGVVQQDDNELFISGLSTGTYELFISAFYTSPATAGINFFLLVPGASTAFWMPNTTGATSAVFNHTQQINLQGSDATVLGVQFFGTVIINTAGTLKVQWCQTASNPTATVVKAGSWMTLRKLT